MTSNIVKGLFSDSYELIVCNNKGKKGTTYHDTSKKALTTEIYWYQQEIISDLREILAETEKMDGTRVKSADVYFFSSMHEFIRDSRDYGTAALTYQLRFHVLPFLEKYANDYPKVRITIQDIAALFQKSALMYGEYTVSNPEPTEEQINQMRTPLLAHDL